MIARVYVCEHCGLESLVADNWLYLHIPTKNGDSWAVRFCSVACLRDYTARFDRRGQ